MEAGGSNLKEFLLNLPEFHNRIILMYPRLTPPEFRVSHIEEQSVHLHYYSKRTGLKDFVRGLLLGLGKMYNTPVTIDLLEDRESRRRSSTRSRPTPRSTQATRVDRWSTPRALWSV
jgi:hypothetical protein